MKTAFNASRLAIAVFIVPYVFCFSPALLMIDTNAVEVIRIVITSFIGIFGVAAGLEGYLKKEMNPLQRILFVVAGLMLIFPSWITDIVGIVMIVAVIAWQYVEAAKKA